MALPVILEMIFLDVDKYIAVFWSGDYEYLDKRIEILYSQNKGKSEIITGLIINFRELGLNLIIQVSKHFVSELKMETSRS